MFDMSITPGNKFVALAKDVASAPPNKVVVRLSFVEDEPPQLWRLVSVRCANDTDLCARPTSTVALADQNRRWQITRPAARINAGSLVQDAGPMAATGHWPALALPECRGLLLPPFGSQPDCPIPTLTPIPTLAHVYA